MRSTKMMRNPLLQVLVLASCGIALYALPSQAAGTKQTSSGRPTVVTGGVTRVIGTSATLEGTVNPRGSATTYYFKYGPTVAYGQQTTTASIAAGTAAIKISQTVTGLQAGYHYRLVATNAVATAEGHDRTFNPKTKKKKSAFTLPKTFKPITVGGAFLLSGSLTGTDNAGRQIVLQASAYPYRTAYADVGPPIVTSATGAFSFRVANLQTSTKLRVAAVGTVPVYSLIVPVQVQVRVLLKVRSSGHPGLVRLYGTVSPAEVGAHVFFQLEKAPKEKLQDSERPTKLEKPGKEHPEAGEKPPVFVNRFTTVVKPGTRALARFSAIVSVRDAGHYRAFIALPAGPLASGHSQTVTLHANPNLQKKNKKTAKASGFAEPSSFYYCLPKTMALGVASDLDHISVHTACDVVRKFVAWLDQGHHVIASCPGGDFVGLGTLDVHTFDGYRLSIKESLVMSRGPSSFRVSGYDGWPVGCN